LNFCNSWFSDADADPEFSVSRFIRAEFKDAAAIRHLVRSAYAKWVPIMGREPKPMTADYDLAIRSHIVDLLLIENELVGLIELVPEQDCVLIENVAVEPSQTGKGYGRALMMHAVDVARSLGRERLRLYTNKLMARNVALYRMLGYVIDREETTPDGRNVVHTSTTI
jgi:GNAT superfamily N-acetyltransferase